MNTCLFRQKIVEIKIFLGIFQLSTAKNVLVLQIALIYPLLIGLTESLVKIPIIWYFDSNSFSLF